MQERYRAPSLHWTIIQWTSPGPANYYLAMVSRGREERGERGEEGRAGQGRSGQEEME